MDSSLQETALYQTALSTMREYKMVEQGDSVAVGVSGGADSVALLTFLYLVRPLFDLKLSVCHLEHGLRGKESRADAAFVQALAQRLGLPFLMEAFDAAGEAEKARVGVEQYARQRRYAFFAACAGGGGKVATAHTQSDAAETLLFNLTRGAGVRGLCGIPRMRGNIIRPLRDCTRVQVEAFLAAAGQSWREDSTNQSDDYSRNYIRHHVVPAMEQLNPALSAALARTMEQMEQQWQMTAALAGAAQAAISEGQNTLNRAGFLALPPPVAAALLGRWLEPFDQLPTAKQIALMTAAARAGQGVVALSARLRFAAGPEMIYLLYERLPEAAFCHPLELPKQTGEAVLCPTAAGKTLKISRISLENTTIAEKFYNKDLKNLVTCAKIEECVLVHPPQADDKIQLQGREHRLGVRYRAGSHGLSPGELSRMAVVADGAGVLWAERLGRAENRGMPFAPGEYYHFQISLEAPNEQL